MGEKENADLQRFFPELEMRTRKEKGELERKNSEREWKNSKLEEEKEELKRKNAKLERKNAELERKNAELERKNAELEETYFSELERKDAKLERKKPYCDTCDMHYDPTSNPRFFCCIDRYHENDDENKWFGDHNESY